MPKVLNKLSLASISMPPKPTSTEALATFKPNRVKEASAERDNPVLEKSKLSSLLSSTVVVSGSSIPSRTNQPRPPISIFSKEREPLYSKKPNGERMALKESLPSQPQALVPALM